MEAIKLIREYKGYSRPELAKRSHVSNRKVCDIESGSCTPTLLQIENIAWGLSVPTWKLFYLEFHDEMWNPEGIKKLLREME